MTRRPKVWEPRAGTSGGEEMAEWGVQWVGPTFSEISGPIVGFITEHRRAPHAWDAWLQVKGAPAFGSCRVRRVE